MEPTQAGVHPTSEDEAIEGDGAVERRCARDIAADAPRLVIRGESFDDETSSYGGERYVARPLRGRVEVIAIPIPATSAHPYSALTDYLNVTFPIPGEDFLPKFVADWRRFLGDSFGALAERGKGLHGYCRSFAFEHGGVQLGMGGQRGAALVTIPGGECALVPCWESANTFFGDVLKARITRWDGAVDDFEGAHGVDMAVDWWRSGRINAGGNKPSCSQQGNWVEPDGSGRTFYVGKRKNGKLLRIYEKGKQLGDPASPWVRWELELHSRSRHIPFEVLLAPGQYVAGAYPCMRWVKHEASRIKTMRKSGEITYAHLVHCAQTAYGRLVNVMQQREGSVEAVIEKLARPGSPARLAGTSLTSDDERPSGGNGAGGDGSETP